MYIYGDDDDDNVPNPFFGGVALAFVIECEGRSFWSRDCSCAWFQFSSNRNTLMSKSDDDDDDGRNQNLS